MHRLSLFFPMVGALTVACQEPSAPDSHGMHDAVIFEEFGLTINLPDESRRFRLDGVVEDLDAHQQKVLDEFELDSVRTVYSNPATLARTMSWRDDSGVTWAISFGLAHPDQRITSARLAHEKYHALGHVAPESVDLVHEVVESRGFRVDWNEHQEELRATMIEVASMHAQGMQLQSLSGSDLVLRAKGILESAADVRD